MTNADILDLHSKECSLWSFKLLDSTSLSDTMKTVAGGRRS